MVSAVASRPRVAVVLSGFGVVGRGAESFLDTVLPGLEEHFDLHVYSRSGRGPGGVKHRAIPRGWVEPLYRSATPVRKLLDTLFLDPLHVEWTTHLLRALPSLLRGRYAVIWHETGLWGGMLLAGVRRRTGARLLDIAHGAHAGWEVPFARRRPDLYVTFTQWAAQAIRQEVPGLRVEVVPQVVDTEAFSPDAEPRRLDVRGPRVLMVGALSAEKDPELAVRAVAATDASLVIAGDGPLAERIDRLAAEQLGGDRYQRLAVPHAEMPELYAAADAVLLTSPLESAPLSVLEALACGKPMVTSSDESRREMVGDAGVLVEDRDPATWAAAVRSALEEDWSGRARSRALDFRLENTVERLKHLLAELSEEAA